MAIATLTIAKTLIFQKYFQSYNCLNAWVQIDELEFRTILPN